MSSLEQESIASLKGHIRRLEARLDFLYKHLGVTYMAEMSPTDDPRIVAALRANKTLEAIKIYREATNTTLGEAKMAVEEIRGRLGL